MSVQQSPQALRERWTYEYFASLSLFVYLDDMSVFSLSLFELSSLCHFSDDSLHSLKI